MIKLAIVGTGGMAKQHAESYAKIPDCQVVAVCDVDYAKAQAFAKNHSIGKAYSDLAAMLADCQFDGISNVTPDRFHKPVTLQALAAGKHVLCEKPLAVNATDALEMATAANAAGLINMVNLSYRDAPAIQHAKTLIQAGNIGAIKHVEASYLQSWLVSNQWGDWKSEDMWLWRLSSEHGSKGVLGDVGIHILDFACFPVGEASEVYCQLACFDKAPDNKIGNYTLDANDSALIQVKYANGAMGSIHTTRWASGQINSLRLRIYGDKGGLEVDLDKSLKSLQICRGDNVHNAVWETIECPATPNNYQRFVNSIKTGINDQPDFNHGAKMQTLIDGCFESDRLKATIKL